VDNSKSAVWLRLHCLPPRTHAHRLAPPHVLRRYLGVLREELRAHADDPRRATVGARIHRVNVTFRRTTSGLMRVANPDPASMAGRVTGLLASCGQAVTYCRSRLPSRASASTFCVVDQCGYGDNRNAMRRTRNGAGSAFGLAGAYLEAGTQAMCHSAGVSSTPCAVPAVTTQADGGAAMDRRAFIGTLASGLLAAPLAAEAQAGKVLCHSYRTTSGWPAGRAPRGCSPWGVRASGAGQNERQERGGHR